MAAFLLLRFQFACWTLAPWRLTVTLLNIYYCLLLCRWGDSARDFLSETVALNDPNEIWRHCVWACVQKDDALIPAPFHDGYVSSLLSSCVGCHSDDEWLPSAFVSGGGMWQSYGQMPACILLFFLQKILSHCFYYCLPPSSSHDGLSLTHCPFFFPVLSSMIHSILNNTLPSPVSLSWPVRCFRNNNGAEANAVTRAITELCNATEHRQRSIPDGHFLCQTGNSTELPQCHISF